MSPREKKYLTAALTYIIGVSFGMYAMTHHTQSTLLVGIGVVCIFTNLALVNWCSRS